MKRITFFMKIRRQLAVFNTSFNSNGTRSSIKRNHFVHFLQREKIVFTVSDPVEAMTCTQHFKLIIFFNEFPQFFNRSGIVYLVGTIFDITGPVFQIISGRPTG